MIPPRAPTVPNRPQEDRVFMSVTRRNLIISPIGDTSVHASWLSHPELRSFDLFLIYYGQADDFGRAKPTTTCAARASSGS